MKPLAISWVGLGILLAGWAGPLPRLVPASFAAHMTLHMLVVAVAVPFIAIGIAPHFREIAGRASVHSLAVAASVLDLAVIWSWHLPLLHEASRASAFYLAAEQASFALVTLMLWVLAFAGSPLAGAGALFFTSMHMTLLGALLGLAPSPSYHTHGGGFVPFRLTPMQDQQLGGVIMLGVGGAAYLSAGLVLMARVLRRVPS